MNTSTAENERCFDCYKSSQRILFVGEGDFSFSACLARELCTAENMVATSYLDKDLLVQKHRSSQSNLEELERLGCLLLYKVDVHKMKAHPVLKNMKFDVIIYNFPHAGHYAHLRENHWELIEMHMELVRGYFKNASKMLSDGGEVHLRHRDDNTYKKWNAVLLASESGLKLKEKVAFETSDYPGYKNVRGGDINTNDTFPIPFLSAFTYMFALDPPLPKIKDEVHLPLEMKAKVHDDQVKDNVSEQQKNVHHELSKNNEVGDNLDVQVVGMKISGVEDDLDQYVPELEMKDDGNEDDAKNVEFHDDDDHHLPKRDEVGDDFRQKDESNVVEEEHMKNINNDVDNDRLVEDQQVHDEAYVNVLEIKDDTHERHTNNGIYEHGDVCLSEGLMKVSDHDHDHDHDGDIIAGSKVKNEVDDHHPNNKDEVDE